MEIVRNWHLFQDAEGRTHVQGAVYGSTKYDNGTLISTSSCIVEQEMDYWVAKTASGSTYVLLPESMDPRFRGLI